MKNLKTEDVLKALFVLLCHEGGTMTVTKQCIDQVPDGWPNTIHIDQPGIGLIRLQIKPEAQSEINKRILLN